jgi:triosephosphate isomerase
MRQLFVAGNWKMNLDGRRCAELAAGLNEEIGDVTDVRLAVCPPFVYLRDVLDIVSGTTIDVGAQNMYAEDEGAYTGEVAGSMLADVGCRYVILGHSERRHVIGESDQAINRKILKALEVGLEPIVCLGEKLDQREADQTEDVVSGQFISALKGVSAGQMASVTIAYEPVWAIGTGRNATPGQAEEVHALLRKLLEHMYGAGVAEQTVIQYGGSVKPANATELMAMPNVDGALVGGASLEADSFAAIVQAGCAVTK